MTTPCRVYLYGVSKERALTCFDEIKANTLQLEKKYSFYDRGSYLSQKINNRDKNRIKVDSQTASILKKVRELSAAVNGNFDVTLGTLKQLYTLESKNEFLAEHERLKDRVGLQNWDIQNRFLSFKYDETLIDLGGVIKEYAVDEAVRIIAKHNIASALVNFGGDLFCVGRKEGRKFNISVKNPKNKEEALFNLGLEHEGLTTSANYERSYSIGDLELPHIIGSQSEAILSATVVSESVLKSGIYSTSFMIDTAIDFPDSLKVVLIDNDLKLHQNIIR